MLIVHSYSCTNQYFTSLAMQQIVAFHILVFPLRLYLLFSSIQEQMSALLPWESVLHNFKLCALMQTLIEKEKCLLQEVHSALWWIGLNVNIWYSRPTCISSNYSQLSKTNSLKRHTNGYITCMVNNLGSRLRSHAQIHVRVTDRFFHLRWRRKSFKKSTNL